MCHRGMSRWEHQESEGSAEPQLSDFEIFADLYPRLRRFAAVVADLDMEPDDLVQDALAATLRRHDLSELDKPIAYLKRAIVNSVSNQRRRAGTFRRLLPKLASASSSSDHYPSDLAVLDELAPLDRAVIFLADVEGQPHALIAQELGLTPSAVRKRAHRARKQLRRILQPDLIPISEDNA